MSKEMTFGLQKAVTQSLTKKKALDHLIKQTSLQYNEEPIPAIHIGYNGTGNGHKLCTKAGETCIACALIYWATKKKEYAKLALKVLSKWSTINKSFKGDNAPLEAAWCVCSFARAAELLKYATDNEITDEFNRVEPLFLQWLDNVMMPVLKDQHVWSWKIRGNWHFSILCARMQIAIFKNDKSEFDWVVRTYKEIFPQALVNNGCRGENVETKRDMTHSMFLLGGMTQVPEMAFHQGVKLYDHRLLECIELQAQLMLKEIPNGLQAKDIKTPYGYWPEPIFEIPFAHFHDRECKSMPHTQKLIETIPHVRPDHVTFHWGGNTLTHAC